MQAFRHSSKLTLIALLAILVQLLLPMQHASAMAAHAGGNPLLMAFCGTASPQALQRLSEAAPPELRVALNLQAAQNQAQSDDAPCNFCGAVASLQAAALASTPMVLALSPASKLVSFSSADAMPAQRTTRPPPARGPPLPS